MKEKIVYRLKRVLNLLRQPSTYAGLAGIALVSGLSVPEFQNISLAIAGFASVAAMILNEATAKLPQKPEKK